MPRAALARRPSGPRLVLTDPAWSLEARQSASNDGARARPSSRDGPPASPAFGSDLHALGAAFYRLLVGRNVEADSGFPPSPREVNPELSVDLDRLLMKLLNPEPDRGYQSAAALVEDLGRLGASPSSTPSGAPDCFVGRREELGRAVARLERKRPTAIGVRGEAGMGKSALLRRLELEAQLMEYRTFGARCYTGKTEPLALVRALFERLIPAGHAGRSPRARLRRLLAELDDASRSPAPSPGGPQRLLTQLVDLLVEAAAAQPTLRIVDDAHRADVLSVQLLAMLVRVLTTAGDEKPGTASILSIVVSFPSESPFQASVKPLREALGLARIEKGRLEVDQARALVLDLGPLPSRTVDEWLDLVLAAQSELRTRIKESPGLGGRPFAVRQAIQLGGSRLAEKKIPGDDLLGFHLEYLQTLEPAERELLEALAFVARPSGRQLLGAILDRPASRVDELLVSLSRDGTVAEESGRFFVQHGSFQTWMQGTVTGADARALHRRIAVALEAIGKESAEETADHWLRSDTPRAGIACGLAAARRLARSHEDRRALDFYHSVLALLPDEQTRLRRAVAEEAAESHARSGEPQRAVEILDGLIGDATGAAETARLRTRLGVFCHRASEPSRARVHLEAALALLAEATGPERMSERLRVESELAEIAINRSEYAEAETICQRALAHLAGSRDSDLPVAARREKMVLLETRAHLDLRRFHYQEARGFFERSLEVGASLDADGEKSLILNNLGTLHTQENRFHAAIDCYRRSAKLSAKLGDDQSLAVVLSNLAALHAKTGDPEAADEALARASRHESRCDSRRARFVRLHNAGMVDLCLGRYAAAIETFKTSLTVGEELKDVFLVAFDLVYLGECHLFRGEAKAALAVFERALDLGASLPGPVKPMIAARRAQIAGLRGDSRGAVEACSAWEEGEQGAAPGVPYLDGWNRIFLGWSRRLIGAYEKATEDLERARAFFLRTRVPSGEIHARLELAALDADQGRVQAAQRKLAAVRKRYTCGRGALKNPMLAARLCSYQVRVLLEQKSVEVDECTSLLVEAESFLIGRHFRDLETLVGRLRQRLELKRPARRRASSPSRLHAGAAMDWIDAFQSAGKTLVRDLEEEMRDLEEGPTGRTPATLRRHLQNFESSFEAARRRLENEAPPKELPLRADSLLGDSSLMSTVGRLIRQCAPSTLCVLISGETGTGKELVARAVHGESPRRAGPFVSINCAALPEQLLEAELFGYRSGAFSGAEKDDPGLLVSARGGTVLFDEIAEMPAALQGKLLRLVDRSCVRPLGGEDEVEIDVRYLFATNRDVREPLGAGSFRQDLFFRISGFEIHVPPLRERLEDLPLLVEHFLNESSLGGVTPRLDEGALRALATYPWPGNVRELQNVISRLVLMCGDRIDAEDVCRQLGNVEQEGLFPTALLRSRSLSELHRQLEKEYILQLHADEGKDLKRVAARLGITRRALYDRLKRAGLTARDL